MLKNLIVFSLLSVFCISTFAAGMGGGRGGSSFSSSARSYSAPRSYSSYRAPVQQRTVIREYHTNTVHAAPASSGSGGIHPLVAGMAGYMAGDAVNKLANRPAQAQQPQVVYVNGQPQQVQQQPVQVDQLPQQQPIQQVAQQQQPQPVEQSLQNPGFFFWMVITLLFCFGVGVTLHLLKKSRCKYDRIYG